MQINGLIHDNKYFSREYLNERREKHGFDVKRLELFLWDLELFLQFQSIFGDKLILKGGAATQFYLPPEAQRTSVDIDMLFSGTREELEEGLAQIHIKFNKDDTFFMFEPHIPKNPKTTLPLYTYFTNVPTVLTPQELDGRAGYEKDCQEVKVEFITNTDFHSFEKIEGRNLFIGISPYHYNLLNINDLFADKLTTLGPNTVGVQDERKDEQVKQFYDITTLLQYNLEGLEIKSIRDKYWTRSRSECENRKSEFSEDNIKSDVLNQLNQYATVDLDFEHCAMLIKETNSFKGLYLNRSINFNPGTIACGAEKVRLFINELFDDKGNMDVIKSALSLSEQLLLSDLSGPIKGEVSKELRLAFLEKFDIFFSDISEKDLRGKNPNRIFWSIVTRDNIGELRTIISECIKNIN